MEMSLPWEVGDPPDALLSLMGSFGRWGGGHAVMVPSSGSCSGSSSRTQCAGILPRRCAGHGCEVPGTRERGDADEGMGGDAAYEQTQLDLGLTDITKFSSYSKLWRMLVSEDETPSRSRACSWGPSSLKCCGFASGVAVLLILPWILWCCNRYFVNDEPFRIRNHLRE